MPNQTAVQVGKSKANQHYKMDKRRCAWKLTMPPTGEPGDQIPADCVVPMARVCKCGVSALTDPKDLLDIFSEAKSVPGLFEITQEHLNTNEKFLEYVENAPKLDKKKCYWKLTMPPTGSSGDQIPMSCIVPMGRACNCGITAVVSLDRLVSVFPDELNPLEINVEELNSNESFLAYLRELSEDYED